MRRLLAGGVLLAFVAVTWLGAPGASAQEKSFFMQRAHVQVDVDDDGAVHVEEQLTYSFCGSFTGGYREIPLREGEEIVDISVSEGGQEYSPGASAELGSSGAPGTYGVARESDFVRIVWHYSALNENRTFTVRYTFHNLLTAHDDVADLYLQVWGDEWDVTLTDLTAQVDLPERAPGEVRVWGHPADRSRGGGAPAARDVARPCKPRTSRPATSSRSGSCSRATFWGIRPSLEPWTARACPAYSKRKPP